MKKEHEINRQIVHICSNKALFQSVVVNVKVESKDKALNSPANLSSCSHLRLYELWVVNKQLGTLIQASEMRFLHGVAEIFLRDGVYNLTTPGQLSKVSACAF